MSGISKPPAKTNHVKWIALEALTQPQPKAAYSYWLKKRKDRLMPHPKDIDPIEIPQLLPYLAIVEVLHESPPDYFFRIEGEFVQKAIGFRRMGRRFSEFKDKYGDVYHRATTRFEAVCNAKAPHAQTSILTGLGQDFYTIEVASLPLSCDGDRVDRIFHCIGFLKRPAEPSHSAL